MEDIPAQTWISPPRWIGVVLEVGERLLRRRFGLEEINEVLESHLESWTI